MPKLCTKKALYGYFLGRIKKKLLLYLKSTPSNLHIYKILQENKNAYIFDQKCLNWVCLC